MTEPKINRDYICTNPANMGHTADGTLTTRTANDIKYIVVHYTGNPDSTAKNNAIYYQTSNVGASCNYWVGFDGEVYQSVEDLNIAWHVGIGSNPEPWKYYMKPDGTNESNNYTCIGIELCCRKLNMSTKSAYDTDWYIENKTIASGVNMVQWLMKKYNVDLNHVIRHYDCNSIYKPCPRPFTLDDINTYYKMSGNDMWREFKKMVAGEIPVPTDGNTQKITEPDVEYNTTTRFVGEVANVPASDYLNVRISPNNNGALMKEWSRLANTNKVDVLGQKLDGKWLYIKIAGKYFGWVGAGYIVDTNTKKPSASVQAITAPTKKLKYVGSITRNCVVRISPNSSATKVLGHPNLGVTNLVDVLGSNDKGDYMYVNIVGTKGWIPSSCVKKN